MRSLHSDLLPVQRVHQFIHYDRKSDRRSALPEFFEQMVISSSPDDRITCPVCIGPEDDPGIVSVASAHAQIKGDMLLRLVDHEQPVDLLESRERKACIDRRRDPRGPLQDLLSADQFREDAESLFYTSLDTAVIQDLFHSKVVPVRDEFTDLIFFFLFQSGRFQKALDKVDVSDIDLEFRKPGLLQSVNHHGEHLRIRLHGIQTDQLCSHLSILFQASLIAGMIDKCVSYIAQTDRKVLPLKQRRRRPGDRRRDIRAQREDVSFSVKETVQFLR